ncbi:hypothetical protein ABPG72_005116 [Tetrahymena utriculariae]
MDLNNDFLSNFLCMLQECPVLEDLSLKMQQIGMKTEADKLFQFTRKRNEKLKNLKITLQSLRLPQKFIQVLSDNFQQQLRSDGSFKIFLEIIKPLNNLNQYRDVNTNLGAIARVNFNILLTHIQNFQFIRHKNISDSSLATVAQGLQNLVNLEKLSIYLNFNNISEKGAIKVSNSQNSCSKLKFLSQDLKQIFKYQIYQKKDLTKIQMDTIEFQFQFSVCVKFFLAARDISRYQKTQLRNRSGFFSYQKITRLVITHENQHKLSWQSDRVQ